MSNILITNSTYILFIQIREQKDRKSTFSIQHISLSFFIMISNFFFFLLFFQIVFSYANDQAYMCLARTKCSTTRLTKINRTNPKDCSIYQVMSTKRGVSCISYLHVLSICLIVCNGKFSHSFPLCVCTCIWSTKGFSFPRRSCAIKPVYIKNCLCICDITMKEHENFKQLLQQK